MKGKTILLVLVGILMAFFIAFHGCRMQTVQHAVDKTTTTHQEPVVIQPPTPTLVPSPLIPSPVNPDTDESDEIPIE
jgi:hypothetical protein